MLYGDWIGRWGKSCPDREALVDTVGNRRYTYGQWAKDVYRMVHFLDSLGIRKGRSSRRPVLQPGGIPDPLLCRRPPGGRPGPAEHPPGPGRVHLLPGRLRPQGIFFDEDHQPIVEKMKPKVRMEHPVCFDRRDDGGPESRFPLGRTSLAIPSRKWTSRPRTPS